jgi:hypothetical protein
LLVGGGLVAASFGIDYQFANRPTVMWLIDGGDPHSAIRDLRRDFGAAALERARPCGQPILSSSR